MQPALVEPGVPNLVGTLVAEKYRVERLIGSGGMGTVWEGRHEVLNTRVAIKFIKPAYIEHEESRRRFEIEAKAAAMLQSKHAVQVFDYGLTTDGLPYIVMEYLAGESLSDAILRRGPLPPVEVARIIGQAARALGKAHQMGIVHRDLKPDNIFLAKTDETHSGLPFLVKIVDFGIAKIAEGDSPRGATPRKALGGPTQEGTVIGTPNFMSPEQLTVGGPPGPLSDLWSLGACAFTAMTGRLPFEGDVLGDIVLKVCAAPMPVASQYNPGVPPGFDAWFAKACAREPAKRFQTAEELAQSLATVCGIGRVTMATIDEDRIQYMLRPNPSYQALAEELPEPSSMSPRTALLAGLLLGVTVMVAVAAAMAWKDKLFGSEEVVAPTTSAGLVAPAPGPPPVATPTTTPTTTPERPSSADAPRGTPPRKR